LRGSGLGKVPQESNFWETATMEIHSPARRPPDPSPSGSTGNWIDNYCHGMESVFSPHNIARIRIGSTLAFARLFDSLAHRDILRKSWSGWFTRGRIASWESHGVRVSLNLWTCWSACGSNVFHNITDHATFWPDPAQRD
jgi:hypothetical protein